MIRITIIFILSILPAQAAHSANMRMCTDKDGHKTFTQGSCPKNTSRQTIEVQPAQSPVTAITASERQMLNSVNNKRQVKNTPKNQPKKKKTTRRRRCGG